MCVGEREQGSKHFLWRLRQESASDWLYEWINMFGIGRLFVWCIVNLFFVFVCHRLLRPLVFIGTLWSFCFPTTCFSDIAHKVCFRSPFPINPCCYSQSVASSSLWTSCGDKPDGRCWLAPLPSKDILFHLHLGSILSLCCFAPQAVLVLFLLFLGIFPQCELILKSRLWQSLLNISIFDSTNETNLKPRSFTKAINALGQACFMGG